MSGTLVRYDVDDAVARLTLDSPHNHNALSTALVSQLRDGLAQAAAAPGIRASCSGTPVRHSVRAPT